MYKVIIDDNAEDYYNLTLVSIDKKSYLNIYISQIDGNIKVLISKSNDGFYFKSPCNEANELTVNPMDNLEKTYEYVKNYFLSKGYELVID